MHFMLRKLTVVLALAVGFGLTTSRASAQFCADPAPAVAYYAAAPVAYYPPAPTVSYYAAPAPVVSYYAPPAVSYYAPPAVSYYAAPAVSYYAAPAPVYAAPAAVSTTYRYGLFGRRQATYTQYYYSPGIVYP